MALISEEYRAINKRMHENENYGIMGVRLAASVLGMCKEVNSRDVLDYGCGKRLLEKELGFPIKNYDPAIAGLDAPPAPADIVVCGDVLEHIEPECLDDVLDDLKRVTKRIGLFVICTCPAQKFLPDGRNAHLIQQEWNWWSPRILARFDLLGMQILKNDIWAIVINPEVNYERNG